MHYDVCLIPLLACENAAPPSPSFALSLVVHADAHHVQGDPTCYQQVRALWLPRAFFALFCSLLLCSTLALFCSDLLCSHLFFALCSLLLSLLCFSDCHAPIIHMLTVTPPLSLCRFADCHAPMSMCRCTPPPGLHASYSLTRCSVRWMRCLPQHLPCSALNSMAHPLTHAQVHTTLCAHVSL